MHHINIASYIPFKLDLAAGNYSKWRQIMFFVLSKFDVQDHVEEYSNPEDQGAIWRHDDITIVLWFYATISDELYDVVMTPKSTAYQVWVSLHTFFRDNQPGRTIHLSAEFRSVIQGDLSIAAYCRCLKSLADALADVDEPVTDRTLTLQLIRGLNARFHVMATVLPMQIPFPTFVQARSRLLLEEIALNERDRGSSSTALVINNSTTERGSSSTDRTTQGGHNNDRGKAPAHDRGNGGDRGRGNRGRGRGNRGRGNNNGNGGRGQNHQQQQPATTPWMGYFAPWGAPVPPQWRAPWIPPNAVGVLGPRLANPAQAYPMMYQPPPGTPSAALSSSWDQQSMLNAAMSNLQV
jgi:hypothetical protein